MDWIAFAKEWRQGYYRIIADVHAGKKESLLVDEMHRQVSETFTALTCDDPVRDFPASASGRIAGVPEMVTLDHDLVRGGQDCA